MPPKPPFVTTIDYADHMEYASRSHVLAPSNKTILGELKFVFKILEATGNIKVALLDSTSGRIHPDLLATILLGLLPRSRRPLIIFMGAMWQKDSGIKGFVQKIILKLADRAIIRYAVQSTDEIPLFSSAWGIPESKLRFIPYFYTFTEKKLAAPAPPQENYIFAGGNSHRDYLPYLEAAETLREYEFVIATSLLQGKTLPPNVRANFVSRDEFVRLMRASRAVVVPMKQNLIRAVGQQTYLNAMLLEKPTIVTDALGVRDHVQDGRTAIVVDGSPASYIKAIQKVLDPANKTQIEQMCKLARRTVLEKYNFQNHATCLLAVLDEAIQEAIIDNNKK
jgi:glycosyltransferase involved in cell wall biosynthesis